LHTSGAPSPALYCAFSFDVASKTCFLDMLLLILNATFQKIEAIKILISLFYALLLNFLFSFSLKNKEIFFFSIYWLIKHSIIVSSLPMIPFYPESFVQNVINNYFSLNFY
jgi:hypothetical protein